MRKQYIIVLVCAIFLISGGCGVPKEEFEKKVGELSAAEKEIAKLELTIKENESRIAELEKRNEQVVKKKR